MSNLGKFTISALAIVELRNSTIQEEIKLEYDMIEEDGGYMWELHGYGGRGALTSDDVYATPEECVESADDYTNAWAFMREKELEGQYWSKVV